jgi:hypothetical protein
MRKRFEEDLSKLAFGDLDAEEARRLEMRTLSDPEASQTFQTYCRMKEELRSLAQDVPADQLSKERLREAILNRGMKDQPPRTAKPTWIWMPAMAAVLAFGFMFVKGRLPINGNHGPMVVDNSKAKPEFDVPDLTVPVPANSDSAVVGQRKPGLVIEKEPARVASNLDSAARHRRKNDGMTNRNQHADLMATVPDLEFPKASEESLAAAPLTEPVTFGEKSEPAPRDVARMGPGSPSPAGPGGKTVAAAPTIILIQSETDADTGTLKAREVSTANVVIGG